MEENNLIKYQSGQLQKLTNAIAVTNKLLADVQTKYKIVHLDDHDAIAKGVKKIIQSKFPNISILHFLEPLSALTYITENIKSIDLVITDFNHLGINGYEFAMRVKEITKEHNKLIPTILLTMRVDCDIISKGLQEELFAEYLQKDISEEALIKVVKKYLRV